MTKDIQKFILRSSACRLHAHTTIHTNIWHELRECLRARRFQASLLLYTTCVRSWCNWRANCVAAKDTDLPDRSLTSCVPWLHVTSPRLLKVTSPRLSLVIFSHLHSRPLSNILLTNLRTFPTCYITGLSQLINIYLWWRNNKYHGHLLKTLPV